MAYYNCLLLDVDGTLLDFNAAEHKAFMETMQHFELPATHEVFDQYLEINKVLWANLEQGRAKRDRVLVERFEKLLKQMNTKGDAAQMNKFYLNQLGTHADIIPGTLEAVAELAEVATLAVVSNGVEAVQLSRLQASHLEPFMDGVFISERVGAEKPRRRIFETALKQLGIENAKKVLVVGDSLSADIKGAQNCGLASCWFNPDGQEPPAENPPTFTVRNLTELYSIVMEPDELENVGQKNKKHQFENP